jgi:hypothetical protein
MSSVSAVHVDCAAHRHSRSRNESQNESRVVESSEIDIGARAFDLAPQNYAQLALAEGDSWCSLGGVSAGSILYQRDFRQKIST